MKQFPKISIIIPTLNASLTIDNAIESIFKQVYSNFEILILDTFSTDNTLEIVKSYNNEKVKIICEKDNGIYDAMNKGIKIASGEWLFFMGSDDVLADETVLNDVAYFISNNKCNVIYGDVEVLGDAGWNKGEKIYGGKFTFYKLLRRNICHQSIFYKKSFLLKHNLYYDLNYPISADWKLNLNCWIKTNFIYKKRIIAKFSAGGVSSIEKNADKFYNDIKEDFRIYYNAPFKNIFVRNLFKLYRLFFKKNL